jgi:hypothetical protein
VVQRHVNPVSITDKFDDTKVLDLNRIEGSAKDPNARIWPFKVMHGKQPYDTVNKTLVVNHVWGDDDTALGNTTTMPSRSRPAWTMPACPTAASLASSKPA